MLYSFEWPDALPLRVCAFVCMSVITNRSLPCRECVCFLWWWWTVPWYLLYDMEMLHWQDKAWIMMNYFMGSQRNSPHTLIYVHAFSLTKLIQLCSNQQTVLTTTGKNNCFFMSENTTNSVQVQWMFNVQGALTWIDRSNEIRLCWLPSVCVCVSGLGIAVLPEGRHLEAGLASESQHQQQPVCLHEGESAPELLSVITG